jgi:glycosyltransferase involved in cell wall biosynthesis
MFSLSVGVALCTCNGARFLPIQLESIMAQTVLPTEIVVSDDRSDDDTWRLVLEWASQVAEPRGIKVTLVQNQTRLGVTRNFEQACLELQTDIVFLCDQDDCWPKDKIAKMLKAFANRQVMLVHSNARLVDAELKDLGVSLFDALRISDRERVLLGEQRFLEIYCRRNLVTGAAAAFRRSLLGIAKPFPKEWVHDEWLAAMAASSGRIVVLQECLLSYRQHGSNVIGMPISFRDQIAHIVKRRMESTRKVFFELRVSKLAQWLERLNSSNLGSPADLDCIREAKNHFEVRSRMTGNPLQRFPVIWQEWKAGNYRRFSGGRGGFVRDLINL